MLNKSKLDILIWNEPIIDDFSMEDAINIAHVTYRVHGYLEGFLLATYVIHYLNYDSENLSEVNSTFTGFSEFQGTIDGLSGSVVFSESGRTQNKETYSELTIKKGTEIGAFKTVSGKMSCYKRENLIELTSYFKKNKIVSSQKKCLSKDL